jgi:hypothetical protein
MALQQSAAMLQIIGFFQELQADAEFMAFINEAAKYDVRWESGMVPRIPCLGLLGQLLTEEGAYEPEASELGKVLSPEKLLAIVKRADELDGPAAVMSNVGSALMVNPVSMAMLAQQGISVVIAHDAQDYLDEQDVYEPMVCYVSEGQKFML